MNLSPQPLAKAAEHLHFEMCCLVFSEFLLSLSLDMLRPTAYCWVHSWIFNNCQTFFKTAPNMLTKYMTKCLLCELPPDHGGVLLSAEEQC